MLRDVMGGETKLFRLRALDPEAEIRLIERLLDPEIGCSWDISHFRQHDIRVAPVRFQVIAYDLNVDGCGQSKIENLPDHVGGQESERNARELFREGQTKLMNVIVRGMVLDGQRYKEVGVQTSHH